MSLTRQSSHVLQWVQQRGFKARAARSALKPHYTVKTTFNYDDIEPVKNWEKACVMGDSGSNYEKHNDLTKHYHNQELFVELNHAPYYSFFSGYYGAFWPAHLGGGYLKFLRRRSDIEGVYKNKNPLLNWWHRKLDERGIQMEFPRGQDYQIVCRWFLSIYVVVFIVNQLINFKKHFDNAKPLPPPDDYPARINLPFYVYIIHDISAPNLEQ